VKVEGHTFSCWFSTAQKGRHDSGRFTRCFSAIRVNGIGLHFLLCAKKLPAVSGATY
jgi:hypothetical protein